MSFKYYESVKNFEKMYGNVNMVDKTILDIGADWGSTADFFLRSGAKKVIAVDSSTRYIKKMRELFKGDRRVVPVLMNIKTAEDIQTLLELYKPDLTKVDCEGCEAVLSGVPNLGDCEEYLVETHTEEIRKNLLKAFANLFFVEEQQRFNVNLYVIHWRKTK